MAHILHSQQSLIENLFAGHTTAAYEMYSQIHNACGIQLMQSVPYCIYVQLKINILQFTINLFHSYEYMLKH